MGADSEAMTPTTSVVDCLRAQAAKQAASQATDQGGSSRVQEVPICQRHRTGGSSQGETVPVTSLLPPPAVSLPRPSTVSLVGASPNTIHRPDMPFSTFGFRGPYVTSFPSRALNSMGRKIWERMGRLNVPGDIAAEDPECEFNKAPFDLQRVWT